MLVRNAVLRVCYGAGREGLAENSNRTVVSAQVSVLWDSFRGSSKKTETSSRFCSGVCVMGQV